jgi:hypothetical protein
MITHIYEIMSDRIYNQTYKDEFEKYSLFIIINYISLYLCKIKRLIFLHKYSEI